MLNQLNQLLENGTIDKFLYDTYVLFELDPKGKAFLNDMIMDSRMERPIAFTGAAFAWQEGRRSVWRTIKENIYQVRHDLKKIVSEVFE